MEFLRENNREQGKQDRVKHRDSVYNHFRGTLGENEESGSRYSSEEVRNMAVMLKGKSHVTLKHLTFLKQAFIQHENNISAFLDVTGAINILIRELSGQNASLQLAAAHCCCNLALGNNKQCKQLTKATAPYLILLLHGANYNLLDVCTWTLGNLAGSCLESWSILNDQGAGLQITGLLSTEYTDVVRSAIYALTHWIKAGGHKMASTELQNIAIHACPLLRKESNVYWLIYLLSCYPECNDIFLEKKVVETALELLVEKIQDPHNLNVSEVTALVRIIGNLIVDARGQDAHCLLDNISATLPVFCVLLSSQHAHLRRETLWLVGNLMNHSSKEVQHRFITSNICSKLETRF